MWSGLLHCALSRKEKKTRTTSVFFPFFRLVNWLLPMAAAHKLSCHMRWDRGSVERNNPHYCSNLHFVAKSNLRPCLCVFVRLCARVRFSMRYIIQMKSTIVFSTTRLQSHARRSSSPSLTYFACSVGANSVPEPTHHFEKGPPCDVTKGFWSQPLKMSFSGHKYQSK